jgi:hypothetical protein
MPESGKDELKSGIRPLLWAGFRHVDIYYQPYYINGGYI